MYLTLSKAKINFKQILVLSGLVICCGSRDDSCELKKGEPCSNAAGYCTEGTICCYMKNKYMSKPLALCTEQHNCLIDIEEGNPCSVKYNDCKGNAICEPDVCIFCSFLAGTCRSCKSICFGEGCKSGDTCQCCSSGQFCEFKNTPNRKCSQKQDSGPDLGPYDMGIDIDRKTDFAYDLYTESFIDTYFKTDQTHDK